MRASRVSSSDCTPSETRFTPSAVKAAAFAAVSVPGFASSEISAPGSTANVARTAARSRTELLAVEEARGAAAEEDRADAPPGLGGGGDLALEGREVGLERAGGERPRDEIAVVTLRDAERDVEVDPEGGRGDTAARA